MVQSLSTVRQTPPGKSPARCPVSQTSYSTSTPNSASKTSLTRGAHDAKCPVTRHSSQVNPHNNIPALSQSSATSNQLRVLSSTTRTTSSIPRALNSSYYDVDVDTNSRCDADKSKSRWEYPSPQQFYNALLRKGWKFPEEHMEPMLQLHNRLNEDAWLEIMKWESRNAAEATRLELSHFKGLHDKLSHKARLYQFAKRCFPAYFSFTPPFDRHDWVVRRPSTNEEVRYVIDYYSSRKRIGGEPVFHLDVRPALDSFDNTKLRVTVAIEHLLWRVHAPQLHINTVKLTWCIYGLLFCFVLLECM